MSGLLSWQRAVNDEEEGTRNRRDLSRLPRSEVKKNTAPPHINTQVTESRNARNAPTCTIRR